MALRRVAASLAVACALSVFAPEARGADCAGVVTACINDDTLWPHAGPGRFVSIGSTQTVGTGGIGFAVVASYLSRPIVFDVAAPGAGAGGSQQDAVDNLVDASFLWAYGVTDRLELDLALPLTLIQSGTGLSPITGGTGLKDTAVRDLRFGFAYAWLPPRRDGGDGFGLATRFEVSAPTGDEDQFAGERAAVFVPSASADYRYGRLTAGAEFGARVRPAGQLLNARIGTQLVAAVGVAFELLPRDLLSIGAEAWALPTLTSQQRIEVVDGAYTGTPDHTYVTPAEWQLSLRSVPVRGGALSIELSAGTGIPLDGSLPTTTPRFRSTLGVRWASE